MTNEATINERRGASHIEALKERLPGVVRNVEWQDHDQLTVTVDTNSLPDVVEFLYFGRGGWMPMMVGNDERSIIGAYALYYVLSMEEVHESGIKTAIVTYQTKV